VEFALFHWIEIQMDSKKILRRMLLDGSTVFVQMRWLSLNRADIGCFTIESHAVLKERGENQQRAKGVTLQTQQREADKN
jgi:hypothetical protein